MTKEHVSGTSQEQYNVTDKLNDSTAHQLTLLHIYERTDSND